MLYSVNIRWACGRAVTTSFPVDTCHTSHIASDRRDCEDEVEPLDAERIRRSLQ